MSTASERFTRYDGHLSATDPAPFREAADFIEGGGSVAGALELLTPNHRTTLFHVEKRPPLPMLVAKTPREAAETLRQCADELEEKEA